MLLYNNMSKNKKKIISNDTLFFKRDKQNGGILFDSLIHPLQKLFSKESIGDLKSTSATGMIKATDSKKYDKLRKNKKGGYMTSLFFPAGYSTAASTLGLYTLNHSLRKGKTSKTVKKVKKGKKG
jgi:hypothetical protein